MSGMKKFGFYFLMTLYFNSATYGQPLHFRHITTEDGLSQNSINCIYQDHQGFMWFGTQDGLNRYDGYKIITFRHDPGDSNSISHSWIWDIYGDGDQNLWVATWFGLNKYNPQSNKFTKYFPDKTNPDAIRGDRPAAICEDAEGNLWVGTWGGGLNKYIKNKEGFDHFLHDPRYENSLPDNFVRKLFLDHSGRLWIGTWNGLARMIKKDTTISFIRYDQNPENPGPSGSNRITSIAEDKQGHIWVGTFGGGLLKIDAGTGNYTRYLYNTSNSHTIGSNDINSLLIDDRGTIWAGTFSNGLSRLIPETKEFETYVNDPGIETSIGGNSVYSLYQDRSGLIWAGAGGVNVLSLKTRRFNLYTEITNQDFNNITAICEDNSGNIWLASNQHGLIRYNPATHVQVRFAHDPSNLASLSCNNVSDIKCDIYGNIWVGTRGRGLNLWIPDKGKFKHIQHDRQGKVVKNSMKYINGLETDQSGHIWIATYDQGLIRFDPASGQYKNFKSNPKDSHSLSGNYLLHLYADSKHTLWIGVWGGGLCRFNKEKETFTRYVHDSDNHNSLIDDIVHSIHEVKTDSGRVIWVGTSNGLSYFLPDKSPVSFRHFTTKDGLNSNVVYGILHDDRGNLWLSGNSGLSRFNPITLQTTNFDIGDGLQGNEFNAGACTILSNGMFLFGGIEGFNAFYPDSIQNSDFPAPIAITEFLVLNKEKYSPLEIQSINDVKLPYKENFFSFEFAALDFTDPLKNMYTYQLTGIDRDWINAGHRRFASYTDIRPGDYTFQVKGTNSDGVWSNQIQQFRIRIMPPYWQTWWFRLLVLLVLSILLYALHRFRVNKLLELERLRVRIASDLHDDIGSALTRIAIHSEQLQSEKNPEKVPGTSKKIGALSRSVISTMSDIVWSIDARNDTWGNMLDRMKDLVYNSLLLKEVNTTFDIKGIDESHKILLKYRQNIFYIFKEAINNIMKHSNATSVRIVIHKSPHTFEMEIAENGNGFDLKDVRYGNGLRNMKMRAENIGGILDILTETGVKVKLKVKGI